MRPAAGARVEEVIDKDPTDEIVCTNLKHWKAGKKKSSRRCTGLAGEVGEEEQREERWAGVRKPSWAGPKLG